MRNATRPFRSPGRWGGDGAWAVGLGEGSSQSSGLRGGGGDGGTALGEGRIFTLDTVEPASGLRSP